ncbi:UNVERIFIED_CONTAM: hypothetical protein FKN15_060213 [Acipenser sinensis]
MGKALSPPSWAVDVLGPLSIPAPHHNGKDSLQTDASVHRGDTPAMAGHITLGSWPSGVLPLCPSPPPAFAEFAASHRYNPCADSGGAKTNTRCPLKRVPSAARFFTHCELTVQPPQSYSVRGQRSSGQLTGKPAGARPDYRGRWCAVSRGHPGRPNPPSPRATLGQLSAAPWKLPSTVGCGIAWTRTRDVQAIEHILHS